MRYDTIIIGGGLSGLTCGIALAKGGQRVAVIGAGQSTLHFNSGSISLLGYDTEGNTVASPLEAMEQLPATHPYHRVGDKAARAAEAAQLLAEAGLKMKGEAKANHFRLTPIGLTKPAWLTMEGLVTSQEADKLPYKKVTVANIRGYLDLPTEFLVDNLRRLKVEVELKEFATDTLDFARHTPCELRATNIAKYLSDYENLAEVAEAINSLNASGEVILLPAVLGLTQQAETIARLRKLVRKPIEFVATMPSSVPGTHIQMQLIKRLQQLGGRYFRSDTVKNGKIVGSKVASVETENLADELLLADHYVLCSGSFQSRGLRSNYEGIYEPVFGLDVLAEKNRADWHADYVFDAQPYMAFGVKTDEKLHATIDGKTIENLYAAGSVLGGHNSIKLDDATGVAMLTALEVAHNILSK